MENNHHYRQDAKSAKKLKGLEVDDLTPRDALNLIADWKKKVSE